MALVVEDGTGKATAESYISVADAGTYHTNRGNTAWAALTSDTVREQYLRKATEYMDFTYQWTGDRTYPTVQALDWPRTGVTLKGDAIDDEEIPELIKRACAELALKVASGELAADLTQGVISQTVGPISVTYDQNSPQRTRYAQVEAMLAPLLTAGGSTNMMKLARV
jgi:hypothetical protein